MRASLWAVVLLGTCALGACGTSSLTGSTGTGGGSGLGGSPGNVTFVLATPPSIPFCDQHTCSGGGEHLSILMTDGTALNWPAGGIVCGMDCSTCRELACPEVAIVCPAPEGVVYTGESTSWDGSFIATSSCGSAHVACSESRYATPGHYVARFCATPGSVSQPDAGLPVCSATGPAVCTETTFDFPGAGTVQLTLPAGQTGLQ
jgi:hypothetical protein